MILYNPFFDLNWVELTVMIIIMLQKIFISDFISDNNCFL